MPGSETGTKVSGVVTALVALAVLSAVEDGRWVVTGAGHGNGGRTRIGGLCAACVDKTGVDGGGVSVLTSHGAPVFMHATDDISRVIEDLQFTLGEGPCIDAASSRAPVRVPDLAASAGELADRWPGFLAQVAETEARALFAFPILVAGVPLGILDLYRRTPGDLDPEQFAIGLSGVEAMGTTLLAPDDDEDASYPLTVHRAAGMVMVQLGTTIQEALVRIRATAFLEGALAVAIATEVLDGRRRFTKEER